MNTLELAAIIRAHRDDSLGVEDGELSNERAEALNHYHGRPYGNEVEGRSQVVSRDLSEAVDWCMPAIMRAFVQSGNIAEFQAIGPEDEQLSQQESDYVNHVIMRDNPGFLVLHDAIKDTLLLKNGYVKHWWEETEEIEEESYTGLSMEQIVVMLQEIEAYGDSVEVVGQEVRPVEMPTPQGAMPLELFDIKLKVKRKCGKLMLQAVPTEEVRVSKRCRGSLQDSPFVEHVTRKTRSDLIEMGMPRDFVDGLPAWNEVDQSSQVNARDSISDESESLGTNVMDRTMDEIEFCEAYIRVDYDGDGVAELRKVVTVGEKVPPGEDWNQPINACALTGFVAKRIPHRHIGESLDDELADLQEIKTTLTRQLLDNIYNTNHNQWLVNERVNLKDFQTSRPGGVKRVRGMEPIGGAVEPVVATPIINQILPVVNYFDTVKENRTGVTKASTGMDPDTLREATKGAFLENLNRASQKIEMMTRLIAETGVKEMVMQVHGLLIRHQDKSKMVQMRGKWVNVNPQEWRKRTDLTVTVGIGTGNAEEKRQKLMMLSGLQDKIGQMGMVGPEQAYALFEDFAKALGFDVPDRYVMSPQSPQFQQMMQQRQSQPNPQVQIAQMQAQIQAQAEIQKATAVEQIRAQTDMARIQAENERQAQNDARDAQREAANDQAEMMMQRMEMMMEKYKADLDAQVKLLIASIPPVTQPINPMEPPIV